MKIQNRLVLIGLIGILAISNYSTSPTHAVVDTTGAILSSVSFDRGIANVGDTVTVTVITYDLETGIDYCYANIRGSNDEGLIGVNLSYNPDTGVCTGSFNVNQYWSAFAYVYYVELQNGAGNYSYFYDVTDYTSPVVNFVNTTPDATGPIFQSVSFDRSIANVGDSVQISVNAYDVESGINYCYAYLFDLGNNYLKSIYLPMNSTTGLCEGSFEVDQYWPASALIYYVEIGNNADNYTYVYDGTDYVSPIINFGNTTPDSTGPIFSSVWFDSNYRYVGEWLMISANVSDPDSSIDYCWGDLYGDAGSVASFYMSYNTTTGSCNVDIQVQDYWPTSVYLLGIEVHNGAGEYAYFYHGTDFTSSNVTIDYTDIFAPIISSEFEYTYDFEGDVWITIENNEAGWGYVYLDGVQIQSLTFTSPASFWFNTQNYADGEHNITIWVSDYSGNFIEEQYTINIRNTNTYFETYFYGYDNNNDGTDDYMEIQTFIDYSFTSFTYVEVSVNIERYDTNEGIYYGYDHFSDSRNFEGDGSEWFYFYFTPLESGDYQFTVEYYVRDNYLENHDQWNQYLGNQYPNELNWDWNADESDRDGNGDPDHLEFFIDFWYSNLQGVDINIDVKVFRDGEEITSLHDGFHLEGDASHQAVLEFRAEEDGEYHFELEISGIYEFPELFTFDWTGYRYRFGDNPDNTDPSSEGESSAGPDLPVPAGNFYLFVFALLSTTVVIKRKQRSN